MELTGWKNGIERARAFFVGYPFFILETLAACLFVITGKEVTGVLFFSALICFFLVFCEDVLSTTLPFFLACTIATNCYDSYHIFMPTAKYAPVVLACLACRLTVYKKQFFLGGRSGKGLLAVSLAVTLGGIGRFSPVEYVYGAYYVLGLGLGMYFAYLLMLSEFSVRRPHDLKQKFSVVMTLMGTVCVVMIAFGYYRFQKGEIPRLYPEGFSRNNLSTLLMFAMPFPLLFTEERPYTIIATVAFYAAIAVSTSRGGLLFGGVELLVCFAYWIFSAKGKARKVRLIAFFSLLSTFVLLFGKTVYGVVVDRLSEVSDFKKDARWIMLLQAFDRFTKSPVSGYGILDRTIEYEIIRKKGALTWYHMMIPQIVGSMGLIGVGAYSYQFYGRVRLIFERKNGWSTVLGISYLGVLMMSQVNPGEFCPLPFGLLTVLLFVFQEIRLTRYNRPLYKHKINYGYPS